MKESLLSIKNFLEKDGLIKVVIAFAILIISVFVLRGSLDNGTNTFFTITGYLSLVYLVVAGLVYTIVGIVNSIKDMFRK